MRQTFRQVTHLKVTGKVRRVPMTGFDEWTDKEVCGLVCLQYAAVRV